MEDITVVLFDNAVNDEAFYDLIERYESITLEEIEKVPKVTHVARLQYLTGFGQCETCTLCQAVTAYETDQMGEHDSPPNPDEPNCELCVYIEMTDDDCALGLNKSTFRAIKYAESPEGLLKAYRERASYMRGLLINYKKQKEESNGRK